MLNKKYAPTIMESSETQQSYSYWLNQWLLSKKYVVKESTYIRYKNMINNHIKPQLGHYPIDKITSLILENFILRKMESGRLDNHGGISPKTMSDILVIIKESFKYAQIHETAITCNFDRIIIKKSVKEMRVLSYCEEQRLLSVLLTDTDRYKLGIFLCLYTGIRIGELCALRWKHISAVDRTLKIEQTMQRLQYDYTDSTTKTHVIITEPKSHCSIRTIPIPEFLLEHLTSYMGTPDSFLLSDKSTKYIEPRTMQNKFKLYLSKANIEHANFHCLRHTFATRCIEAGFDVKTLSEILGHSSVKITLDKYVHSSMEMKRRNMEKLQLPVYTL